MILESDRLLEQIIRTLEYLNEKFKLKEHGKEKIKKKTPKNTDGMWNVKSSSKHANATSKGKDGDMRMDERTWIKVVKNFPSSV